MTARPRETWVDVARAMCVIIIILFHFLIWVYFPGINNEEGALVQFWRGWVAISEPFHLALLFIVSGLMVGPRLANGIRDPGNLVRIASNYWLYAVWLAVYALCSVVVPQGYPLRVYNVESFLWQMVRPRTIAWYILGLVFWTLVLCLLRRLPPILVLAMTLVVSIGQAYIPRTTGGDLYLQILFYGFFFALGAYAPRAIRWLAAHPIWWKVLLGVATFAGMAAIAPWLVQHGLPGSTVRVLRSLLYSLSLIPVMAMIAMVPVMGRGLARIGRETLPIFVLQLPLLWVVIYLRPRMPWDNELFRVVAPFLIVALVVAAAYAIHWALMRTPLRILFRLPEPIRRRVSGDRARSQR